MKNKFKIFMITATVILIITCLLIITIPNKKSNNKIKIGEVTHSVFYAPLYVAIENDYFKEYGLDVELILTSGADKVSAAVLSNDVEIGFAGAESAIYIYEKNPSDYLQIFSGLTKRDGQFLVGRNDDKDFTLNNLKGKEILVGRSTGMPALNFLNALKNAGINSKDININYSIEFSALSGAFIGGTGEFVNLFEPNVSKLEKEGYGYSLASIGKLSGEMPYTVFYAKSSYIKNNEQTIKAFTKAINKGLKFTKENTPEEIAKVILPQFADTSYKDLVTIISRYKENDSWLESSYISKQLLRNLEDLLIENNLQKKYVNYNKLIVNYE